MRTYTTLIILIACATSVFAQENTYYIYDVHWQRTKKRKEYAYKRNIESTGVNMYTVTNYYYGKGIHSKGEYITTHPEYLADYRSTLFRNDTFTYYREDSTIISKGCYRMGAEHGLWIEYHADGKTISSKTNFKKGKRDGLCTVYDEQGELLSSVIYKDGEVETINKAFTGKRNIFDSLDRSIGAQWYFKGYQVNTNYYVNGDSSAKEPDKEQMPEPKHDITKYLSNSIIYPKEAHKHKIEGRVIVDFAVDKEGYITDIKSRTPEIMRELQLEAIRVIQKMKPWHPGTLNGEPVKVYYSLPISFKIPK